MNLKNNNFDNISYNEVFDIVPTDEFNHLLELVLEVSGFAVATLSFKNYSKIWRQNKIDISDKFDLMLNVLNDQAIKINNIYIKTDESNLVSSFIGVSIAPDNASKPIGVLSLSDTRKIDLTENQKNVLVKVAIQIQKTLQSYFRCYESNIRIKEQDFLKNVFNEMSEGVIVQNEEGAITRYNPGALKVLGMSDEQLLGKLSLEKDWQAIHENGDRFTCSEHPSQECLATGLPKGPKIMGLYPGSKRTKWITVTASPMFLKGEDKPSHVLTTFSDITDRKSYYDRLVDSEKMVSIGLMASELAHEINTPLAVISIASNQTLSLLKSEEFDIDKVLKKIELIDSNVKKISTKISSVNNNTLFKKGEI